jgi:hypothetical protein
MARAGEGMPVLMRVRMHLARNPYADSHTDEQKNHYLLGFGGNK